MGGGFQEALDGYPYLMHPIKFWPGDWVKHMAKMNQLVGEKNHLDTSVTRKRLVCPFTRNKFWKCIVCILSEVTFGLKVHQLLGGNGSICKK